MVDNPYKDIHITNIKKWIQGIYVLFPLREAATVQFNKVAEISSCHWLARDGISAFQAGHPTFTVLWWSSVQYIATVNYQIATGSGRPSSLQGSGGGVNLDHIYCLPACPGKCEYVTFSEALRCP